MECNTKAEPGRIVTLQYDQLLDAAGNLSAAIKQAYGPEGLGILLISGVPDLHELRRRLLPLAQRFADLPVGAKERCEDPLSHYNFGWSHGKETLAGGRPDVNKGSFYANPLHNSVTDDPKLIAAFPSYCRPNLWPGQELPELEAAFQQLGRLICRVGELLARHCDCYVAMYSHEGSAGTLAHTISQSPCPKAEACGEVINWTLSDLLSILGDFVAEETARLLHYFPPSGDGGTEWCGWHTDHGSLTGLTSAMFLRDGKEVPNPDPAAGLYIRDRQQGVIQASIPADHLAFQMGEASQVQSGGLLQATPHCVKGPGHGAMGVSRNTFAVFMQPRWDAAMDLPRGADPQAVGIGQWKAGMNFGEFSEATTAKNYS